MAYNGYCPDDAMDALTGMLENWSPIDLPELLVDQKDGSHISSSGYRLIQVHHTTGTSLIPHVQIILGELIDEYMTWLQSISPFCEAPTIHSGEMVSWLVVYENPTNVSSSLVSEPIGCITLFQPPELPDVTRLDYLWVRPHHRSHGVGLMLLKQAIFKARCQATYVQCALLPVMKEAYSLLNAAGFNAVSGYPPKISHDDWMEWSWFAKNLLETF